jgi:hypothetical protein
MGICIQVFAFSKLTFCSEGEGGGREHCRSREYIIHIVSKEKKTKEAHDSPVKIIEQSTLFILM